jgi:hypothetical protein
MLRARARRAFCTGETANLGGHNPWVSPWVNPRPEICKGMSRDEVTG